MLWDLSRVGGSFRVCFNPVRNSELGLNDDRSKYFEITSTGNIKTSLCVMFALFNGAVLANILQTKVKLEMYSGTFTVMKEIVS